MSIQPAITPSSITSDETGQNQTASNESAARSPLPAPENAGAHADVDAARDPIRPPEPNIQPSSTVGGTGDLTGHLSAVAVMPVHVANVITPEVFAKAEENLATYLGHKLDVGLTKDLMLTLSNILSDSPEGRTGGTDLQLCFKGPMIEANFAEMQREVIKALQEHPQIGKILQTNHTLLIDQVTSDEKGQMMHLHLPNLTPEQYATLMTELASGKHAAKAAHIIAIHPLAKDGAAQPVKDEVQLATELTPVVVKESETKHHVAPKTGKDETALQDVQAATEPTAPVIKEPEIKDPLTPTPKSEQVMESTPVAAEIPAPPAIEVPPVTPVSGPTTGNPAPVVPGPIIEGEHKPKPISAEAPAASIEVPATNMKTINMASVPAVGV